MSYTNPTVADFKAYFTRDFPYGTDPVNEVLDSDIEKAQDIVGLSFNSGLADSQAEYNVLYNYLTAHYMVMDLLAASEGIQGKFEWLQNSKSVGPVSSSYSIPDRVLQNPQLSIFSKTNYGARYLQLIWPKLIGQTFTAEGGTRP